MHIGQLLGEVRQMIERVNGCCCGCCCWYEGAEAVATIRSSAAAAEAFTQPADSQQVMVHK